MKKTLTVNLGGTVFHIDDDAYRLLDNYLNNLKLYFCKQEGAQEIVDDIEMRISELFLEKINAGQQVIAIADVEEVIARMGKPEDFGTTDERADEDTKKTESATFGNTKRRLFRDPDNKVLGGVCSGLAAYFNCSVVVMRLVWFLLLFVWPGFSGGMLLLVYIICWLIIPEARTATEKLAMRGEEVNMENIGKTVTDGFEKAVNEMNDFVKSDKPRTFFQKLGDVLGSILGFLVKACLIILVIVFSPVLFVLALIFVALIFVAIAVLFSGGAFFMQLPYLTWLPGVSPIITVVAIISSIAVIAIPLAAIVYLIASSLFRWSAMATGLKWALFILWAIAFGVVVATLTTVPWDTSFLSCIDFW